MNAALRGHEGRYMRRIALIFALALGAVAIATVGGLAPDAGEAASHREAPAISLDAPADISDFFMFRSYEPGHEGNVVMIMDVIPGEEPSSGPNYWNFDPSVRYAFKIDNNKDGKDDIEFRVQFKNEFRGVIRDAGLPLSYVALPPITALDGSGSEGLGLRQRYSVTMVKHGKRTKIARNLIAVPSNVGPRTMPDYEDLASQGVYETNKGIRIFAGQRQDPFYIDLGGIFDTLHLRREPLPLLTEAEDANDDANAFGFDQLAGFNVHSIAIEVPASMLTKDRKGTNATSQPKLGAYGATSRQKVRIGHRESSNSSPWVQVQRLANPLVNEAIIATARKDRWNAVEPEDEKQFLDFYLNPRLAFALQTVYGVPAATSGRTDLRDLLLKYEPGDERLSELLRLDLSVAPTPLADQKRLGPLAVGGPDAAAWPNGRRPGDDVLDVAVRVVGGPNYIAARAGDGINTGDTPLPAAFPFLGTPESGFDVGNHS